jgi:hypothetical protein
LGGVWIGVDPESHRSRENLSCWRSKRQKEKLMLQETQTPQVLVNSQLTQNYRIASKLGSNSEVHTLLDATGAMHILFVGSDQHAYDVFTDDSSDTGWTVVDLGFPDNNPAAVVAGLLDENNNVLYFLVSTTHVAFSKQGGNPWALLSLGHQYTGVRAESGYAVFGFVDQLTEGYITLYPTANPWSEIGYTDGLWDWRIGATNAGMGLFLSKVGIASESDAGVVVQLPGNDNFGTYCLNTDNIYQSLGV